jgi:hypothetical protein
MATYDIFAEDPPELREALANVVLPPENHYETLTVLMAGEVAKVPIGESIRAEDLFVAVEAQFPDYIPRERRVYGAVLRKLSKLGLIRHSGTAVRRSSGHKGLTVLWVRT